MVALAQPAGARVEVFGEMRRLFQWMHPDPAERALAGPAPLEVLVEGPAGSGKSHLDLQFVKAYCETYPGSKFVLLRAERVAMNETVLDEWENDVLGPTHPSILKGPTRANRDHYELGDGSRVLLRGYDNEYKLYSGQYHGILFVEATELADRLKWVKLHRALRAKPVGGQPWLPLIAELNPREESFWLNQRAHDPFNTGAAFDPAKDPMYRIRTHLWDNPRWYDHDRREWHDEGATYVRRLSGGLTGAPRDNLLHGKWTRPTGAVFPEYDAKRHVIDGRLETKLGKVFLHVTDWPEPVELRWFFASMDAGYEDPSVLGIWGVDGSGRMFELCEVYRQHWTHEDWAQCVVGLAREFPLMALACDHDKALIAAINRALMNARLNPFARTADKTLGLPGNQGKKARIELLRARLHRGEIFFLKDANRSLDAQLQLKSHPIRTVEELPAWVYSPFVFGEDPVDKAGIPDPRCADHGIDMVLYGCAHAAGRGVLDQKPVPPKFAPGTFGALFGKQEWERRNGRQSA